MEDTGLYLRAIAEAWPDLERLLGRQWLAFQGDLLLLLRSLEATDEDPEAVLERILKVLARYPDAEMRFEAALAGLLPDEVLKSGDAPHEESEAPPDRYAIVPVFFGTDRQATGLEPPSEHFGGSRGELTYGIARVSVPDEHEMGRLESPRFWKLEFREDPERHVVLSSIDELTREKFRLRVAEEVAHAKTREGLLFIHGYNVSFADAAKRTAQIAKDLDFSEDEEFKGVALLYSWPSLARKRGYPTDLNNARWTAAHFSEFLRLAASELGLDTLHVIAHSMGNVVLTDFLRTFDPASLPPDAAKLRQIVFAAPDIDAARFRDLAAAFHGKAERLTLYASSQDFALKASKTYQGYRRAGDSTDGIVVADGVDSVDSTRVDTSLVGHSYVGDNDSILSDLFYLLREGKPPGERFRLAAADGAEGRYWTFKA